MFDYLNLNIKIELFEPLSTQNSPTRAAAWPALAETTSDMQVLGF